MTGYWRLTRGLALALAATLLPAASSARAQQDAGARGERMKRLIEEFDTDGDGKLNEQERRAAREKRGGDRGARGTDLRQRMVERFDTDGDGKLSEAERSAAREQMGGRRGRGPRGGPLAMPPAELFDRIDTDGDGSVTKPQFVAFMEKMREEMRTRMGDRPGARRERGRRGDRGPRGGLDRRGGSPELERPAELE